MNNLNGYILLLAGFVLVFATKNLDDRAKKQEIENNNIARAERLVDEKARQERVAIEMSLSANGSDYDKTDKLTYQWIQTNGDPVKLNPNKTSKDINFVARAGEYSFEVSVQDNYGLKANERVTVRVTPEPNNSPDVDIICPM